MAANVSSAEKTQGQNFLDNLVTYRFVRTLTFFMSGAPWWIRAILFCIAISASIASFSYFIGEPPYLLGLHLAIWMGFVPVGLILTHLVYRETFATFYADIVPELSEGAAREIEAFLEENFTTRKQAFLAAPASALATLAIGLALYVNLERVITLATYASIFAVAAFAVNVMHLGALLIAASNRFVSDDVTLYPLAPRHSKVVRGTTVIGRRLVWTMIIMATILVIATSVTRFTLLALVTAGVQYLAVVVVVGVPFVLQRRHLARIVEDRRERTVDELQNEISELYASRDSLTADQRARFDYLMNLHSLMTKGETKNAAGNLFEMARFLSPLLLPLLAFILSNLNLPFGEDILKALESFLSP